MHHDFLQSLYDYNVKMEKVSLLHHCQTANTNANVINSMPRFQSSPKINLMFITRLSCIQWKTWRFLSPASTVSARNVSEYIAYHLRRSHEKKKTEKKEKPAFLESRSLTASLSINQFSYFHVLFSHSAVPNFPIRSTIPRKLPRTW